MFFTSSQPVRLYQGEEYRDAVLFFTSSQPVRLYQGEEYRDAVLFLRLVNQCGYIRAKSIEMLSSRCFKKLFSLTHLQFLPVK